MSIKKAEVVINEREICGLAMVQGNRDIYFYDKSCPFFHISFHKDFSVYLTSNNGSIKSKKLFDSLNISIQQDITPCLFYFPIDNFKYPFVNNEKNKCMKIICQNKDIKTNLLAIKVFLIGKDEIITRVPTHDKNIIDYDMEGMKEDGTITKANDQQWAPICFDHNKIYFDIMSIEKPNLLNNIRMILVNKPNQKIDLTELLKNYQFEIEIDELCPGKILLKKVEIGNNSIYQIIY
jgi:hypothetical protein